MKSKPIERQLAQLTQVIREEITLSLIRENSRVSFFESLVLLQISEIEACTAHDVCVALHKDKAQITRLVNGLVQLNLIERIQNPRDKRQQVLSLTPLGKEELNLIMTVRQNLSRKMTCGIDEDVLQLVSHQLEIMKNNLGE
ncbi:MarR family transcriptional regulator [Vibrio sp.]|nr:MarR family transcriptional regulator [Vibrio sp.]